MNFISFTNLKDPLEYQRFSDLVIKNNLYHLVTKFVYKITISTTISTNSSTNSSIKDYTLFNYDTDSLLRPIITSHILMRQLNITDDEIFLNYIKENCYEFSSIDNYLLKNTKVASFSPKQDVENYMWFFLMDGDKIIASIITDYITTDLLGNKTLHIQYINSYEKSKGYCKIICSQLMTILREWNVDVLRLESVGGISGNKCYIRSFLISGYNYVHIINDDMKLIMNREEGENWINNCAEIGTNFGMDCNENYNMVFYNK